MLTLEEILIRFFAAIIIGALLGLERELIGKEAGIRTSILVASGASLFSMIALMLPYIVGANSNNIPDIIARNSGFLSIIANIVVGVGFLGAGIIMKQESRVHGLTTAAVVWVTAGIGTCIGVGLVREGLIMGVILVILLYLLRGVRVAEDVMKKE